MQLGLSRKNKQIELTSDKGQLHLSKVHPQKNPAHSLTHNASDKKMLAKLRVLNGAAEIGALSTMLSQRELASVGFSSSLLGVVIAETPPMVNQLRQLALKQSDYERFSQSCFERPSLTLPGLSLQKSDQESFTQSCFARQSLTMHSLSLDKASFQSNSFESLTENSLSLTESNSKSLILPSCSLQSENASSSTLQSLSFKRDSLEKTEAKIAHSLVKGEAETNSLPQDRLQEELSQLELDEENAKSGAGTNSFTRKSFLDGILSLNRRLRIFLLVSFQLTCAALFLVTSYVTTSFTASGHSFARST